MDKRYLVFGGDTYYARGGGNDFIGSETTQIAATERAKTLLKTVRKVDFIHISLDWSHVFDARLGKVVARFGELPYGSSSDDATEQMETENK